MRKEVAIVTIKQAPMVETMHLLDNPIWNSLQGSQARFGIGSDQAKRYPADVAPFLAISPEHRNTSAELAALCEPGETLSLVGALPELTNHWEVLQGGKLLQMMSTQSVEVTGSAFDFAELGAEDVPDMLALTALVFPGYFRARTYELGRYIGVRVDSKLVAMAGERLHCGDFREISGVCTHSAFVGRGLARRLVSELVNAHLDQGLTPFLHVDLQNTGAIKLYESLGFTRRAELPLLQLRRGPDSL
jgi:ribosomal protein S18 acetylase RimI-like enzyme